MNIATSDRFTGCLLGGAIGDALGAPLEFILTLQEIRAAFGPRGLCDYAPAYGRLGAITDDTQMTLFTAEGLIDAHRREGEGGISDPVRAVQAAYLRWLATQRGRSSHPLFDPHPRQGLAALPDMNHGRAPGTTCLRSLEGAQAPPNHRTTNDSKGCGGVMRMAPVGLCFREAFELGSDCAALTHGHPSGYLAAGFLAQVIAEIVAGESLAEAINVAIERLKSCPRHWGCLNAVEAAVRLAEEGEPTPERVQELGAGWVAEEALAISLYCALVARNFEHGVLLAVNHAGDSDSTGSITGNILGALWRKQVLPERWLEPLELRSEIEALALDLYRHFAADGIPND